MHCAVITTAGCVALNALFRFGIWFDDVIARRKFVSFPVSLCCFCVYFCVFRSMNTEVLELFQLH